MTFREFQREVSEERVRVGVHLRRARTVFLRSEPTFERLIGPGTIQALRVTFFVGAGLFGAGLYGLLVWEPEYALLLVISGSLLWTVPGRLAIRQVRRLAVADEAFLRYGLRNGLIQLVRRRPEGGWEPLPDYAEGSRPF